MVLADTYGLPPSTDFEQEWRADETAYVGSSFVAARTADEWTAFWKKHDPGAAVPSVDFERSTVVGVVRSASEARLAIYRVELDDVAAPKELVVRTAAGGSLCQKPKSHDLKASRVHLVRVPRTALPIRFVVDGMEDGAMFHWNGGVEEKTLGTIAGVPRAETKWPRAGFREEAEHLAWMALGKDEIEAAKTKLWPGVHGTRYPQLWSVIDVKLEGDRWEIVYDGVKLAVDRDSGKVAR
ncbi:MAG TPA: hypothetical protein VFF73_10705 [Planctomycetota bacterium]|nr:hypothetical protein [Planctomycetota bacterium]